MAAITYPTNPIVSSACYASDCGSTIFKKPLDQLDRKWTKVLEQLRTYFFQSEWYEVYDFIEFVANNYRKYKFRDAFISSCNAILEKEVSAYRFVDGLISRITEQEQLEEIELALAKARGPVQMHLRRALELLSNRDEPDYRNSIKESISAVEGLVAKTVGADKGTLGQLIKTRRRYWSASGAEDGVQ